MGVGVPDRDWYAEIDAWTERFRDIVDPPEPFATAIRDGWTEADRECLARDAAEYHERHVGYLAELVAAGVDLVRLDQKAGNCGACARYEGCGYSLGGETPGLPPPPPLPICPACRHTLNMITPFFLQSMNLTVEDLVDLTEPFIPPD